MKVVNAEEVIQPVRTLKPIAENQVHIAESRRLTHHINLPAGVPLEDLLVPDAWVNAANLLHRHDLIEVLPFDESYWALLIVTEIGPEYASLHTLQKVDLPTRPRTVDDLPLGHSVFFLGSTRLWAALRDSTILKCYFSSKQEAIEWLLEVTRA